MNKTMPIEQKTRTENTFLAEEAGTLFNATMGRNNFFRGYENVQSEILDVFERQVVPREREIEALRAELNDGQMADLVGVYGVFNRRALEAKLLTIAKKDKDEGDGEGILVIMGDVDSLKQLNETASDESEGHLIGDASLCAIAETIVGCTREGDVIARIGGDEFVVVCRAGSIELARAIVEGGEGSNKERGLIRRIKGGVEEKRQELKNRFGANWPEDGEKKPGQLSMGWSFLSAEELAELYQQYERNNETGETSNGDFVSMVVKNADKNMFQEKRSKG